MNAKSEMSLGEFEELVLRKWETFTSNGKIFTDREIRIFKVGKLWISKKWILSYIARLNQSFPGFLEALVSSERPEDCLNAYRRSI